MSDSNIENSDQDNQPPSSSAKGLLATINNWRKNNKWKFRGLLLVVIVMFVWYLSLPEPNTIKVYLNAPGVTDLTVEKPVPDPVVIEFGDSAAALADIDKVINSGIKLSPATAGEWRWQSDRRLVFTPGEDWKVKTAYSISLAKDLFPSHVLLDQYKLSFKTASFTGELVHTEFYQDPSQPKLKKLVSTVRFSHIVDQKEFKSRVSLIMKNADQRVKDEGKAYPFNVSFNKAGYEAYIHSDPISMPLKDQLLVLTIDDSVRSAEGGVTISDDLVASVSVPGMYSFFRVSSSQVTLVRDEHNDPEQVLIIETTDGVQDNILQQNLQVYLLPNDRPADKSRKLAKNYYWNRTEEIGPNILKLSERLELIHLDADREFATQHSFKLEVPPQRHIYVKVNKGIESAGGYILAETYDGINRIPEYQSEIEIMGEGSVLSLAGDKKLSVVSRGNQALVFEVGYVLPSQVQHLVSQTSGQFQNPQFSHYQFDEDNITQRFHEIRNLPVVAPGKSQFTSFDFSRYLNSMEVKNRSGVFLLTISGWDYANKRKTGVSTRRLILMTDLGMLVKKNSDSSRDLFLMSVKKGEPVSGASVSVLGKNGLAIYQTNTDGSGAAQIPDLKEFTHDRTPTVIYITDNNDISFIPYDRYDRQLDLSRFDIGGMRQHGNQDALSAYLFSDRGIYRPGDRFNIGIIVKSSDWSGNLSNIPLQAVITDPRGLVIKDTQFALSEAGFETLSYDTRDSSPTGEYEIRLYLVKDEHDRNLLGSTSIKLEEFLPDRMKISSRFSQERAMGWVHPKDLTARVSLKNLYGTAATDRRVSASMTLSPYNPVFSKYSAFRFYDPLKADKGFTERLLETTTDQQGEAEIVLDLERFTSASYNVSLQVNGFEAEGGRSVSTEHSVLVSAREFLVGYKADGKLDYVGKDSKRLLRFIAIDPALELTHAEGLKLELIEQRYISALVKQDNGTFKYQSVLKEKPMAEEPLKISDQGLDYALPTETPGDYVLRIKDSSGMELNRVKFSIAGEANLARNLEKNAELQVKLNKSDYTPGEMIEVSIRAPYIGAGLITIERDKVYSYKWFKTNSTSSIQSIRLPSGIEGNAYVNVSFVRDIGSAEIYMSPLSYGVAAFTVSRDARKNKVSLEVPYLIRPGEPVEIKYTTQYPGKMVVFAVDEGILQVASYTTPNPLNHFFRKRALEVETAQILDQILPEYSVVREIAAAGGGMYEADSSNLNPFKRRTQKPVVYWSGIIDSDGKGGSLSYTVPDYYNGTLRFMAVVVSADTMGATEQKSLARGHFVLSPNVPTFVAPGDEFSISLNVANNIEGSGKGAKVKVELQTSDQLELVKPSETELMIDEGREKSVRFNLRARAGQLGSANLKFFASASGKSASASVDLSVRPAIPRMVDVKGGYVQQQSVDVELARDMFAEFRTRELMVSATPLGIASGLIRYLDDYPYLCTEQLVSKVFPLVALKDQAEFISDPEKAQSSIDSVVDILRSRQNAEGAFGFWAANSHVSPIQSLYTLHFLRSAQEHGFVIPQSMIVRSLEYARSMAQIDIDNINDARVRAYAIYLLTDSGEVTTRYLNEMNEQMDKFYKNKWQQEISRAYMAAAFKLLQLDNEAQALIEDMKLGVKVEADYAVFYDGLSRDAQLLYILSRHFPERLQGIDGKVLNAIVGPVNEGYFNTLSSSYSILALSAYAKRAGQAEDLMLTIQGLDTIGKATSIELPKALYAKFDVDEQHVKLKLDASTGEQPVFYQLTEAGFDRALPASPIQQGIEIHREYRDSQGQIVNKIKMGEELEVRLQVRSVDGAYHYNVAIVDLLPGGFELVLDSTRAQANQWVADYMDLREDRIVLYGTLGKEAQSLNYRIKATNRGQYVVAPPYAESMYNRKIRYRGLGSRIEVE